jgi:hypothetical protein
MKMELQSKKYHFPEQAVQLADKSGLIEFTETVADACEDEIYTPLETGVLTHEDDVGRYLAYFTKSDVVTQLPIHDRASVRSAAKLLDFDARLRPTWNLRSWNQTNDLTHFKIPAKTGAIACGSLEIVILSGAGYQAYLGADESMARDLLEKSTNEGFASQLDFMIFAGAFLSEALAARHKPFHSPSAYRRVTGDVVKEVSIVGSMHGDFRMYQKTMTNAGSLTPTNREALFSPVVYSEVFGYHSIEPAFAAALCAFIIDKSPMGLPQARDDLTNILNNLQLTNIHAGAGLYGDYGNGDSEIETDCEIGYALANSAYGRPLMRLASVPGSETQSLDIEVISDNLVIRNNRRERYNLGIKLDYTDAVELLKTFTGIGGAAMRTSESQIVQVIARAARATSIALQKNQSVHEVLTENFSI